MLTVYTGPMFAGKTTQLISDFFSAQMMGHKSIFLKPNFDDRYSQTSVISHDGETVPCVNIHNPDDIHYYGESYDRIYIDEIQFLEGKEYTKQIRKLLYTGKDIIVAGLDMDANGKPFRTTAYCLAMAGHINKMTAVCSCGAPATLTAKKGDWEDRMRLGSSKEYESLCRTCFIKKLKSRNNG